jgi:hypothetical protein
MKRVLLFAIALGLAMSAFIPQAAGAAAPTRFPGTPFTGSFLAGQVCAFQVDTAPVDFNAVVTVFFDASGHVTRVQFTGHVTDSVTNHVTGKTLIFNASGPGTLFPQPDGSTLAQGGGPSLFALFSTDDRGPALLYIKGRVTFTVSPTGQISHLVSVGPVVDVCAQLAA